MARPAATGSTLASPRDPGSAVLSAGDPVEVQNRFDGSWSDGFEVAEVLGTLPHRTYRIRRLSDGAVLPGRFSHLMVAPSRPAVLFGSASSDRPPLLAGRSAS